MILTDGTHLISDTSEAELHRFANGIGLRRRWYRRKHHHYDLLGGMAAKALKAGAVKVGRRRIAQVDRDRKEGTHGDTV